MAVITATQVELTLDDVNRLADLIRYELVDGRLVRLEMGLRSRYVATKLVRLLDYHCDPDGLAHLFSDTGIKCFPGQPNKMRRPDVLCIRAERLRFEEIPDGFLAIRPDLVVEVISPNDLVIELEAKLDDYRLAGIPLVWLVFPASRRVRVIRLDGPPTDLGSDDELTGEKILPGFRCRVAELFEGPKPSTEPAKGR